ncbi:MAG: hypothetical protein ABI824_06590 [Acidobacteriota bacterium]
MQVQITKRADGAGVLRCVRSDGSVTWQKQTDRHAAYFALHDLTHFAVETTLGFKRGFFGLIAQGWDIDDTTGKGARGPLPPEAAVAESIVGLVQAEQAGGKSWPAEEFNSTLADILTSANSVVPAPVLTEAQIAAVKQRRSEIVEQWNSVPVGEALDLTF